MERKCTGLLTLGLKPHYLDAPILQEMLRLVQKYRDKIAPELIIPQLQWETAPRYLPRLRGMSC